MTLILLSLRNLLRQKRRNILLGLAMAVGVAILITANSFSRGISDTIFNRIMKYVTGHVAVRFNERGGIMREIFRDRQIVWQALNNEPLIEEADESLGMFSRGIGNGKSDNLMIVGVNTSKQLSDKALKELEESFRMKEGRWDDLKRKDIENPAIISEEKADYLNLKTNDILKTRFRNMFGQSQAVRFTLTGISKNDNIFMQSVLFIEETRAKEIFGFRPWETSNINITVKDPQKNAKTLADRIHSRLNPDIASISAVYQGEKVFLFALKSDDETRKKAKDTFKLSSGSFDKALKKDGVIISKNLADKLKGKKEINLKYKKKFEDGEKNFSLEISAVCAKNCFPDNFILINDEKFYDIYYQDLPFEEGAKKLLTDSQKEFLATQWILLRRTTTTDDYKQKYQELARNKWKATTVDVSTMYETASDILKLEKVLNIITVSAVIVLFFIILLGVINTLRMSIKERTREIGTLRAIGMQKKEVMFMFLAETFFLSVLSSLAGILLAFAFMKGLSCIDFNPKDNPLGMLLVNGRLYFLPTLKGILASIFLIISISLLTAFKPAKRAANIAPAKALGHFE